MNGELSLKLPDRDIAMPRLSLDTTHILFKEINVSEI